MRVCAYMRACCVVCVRMCVHVVWCVCARVIQVEHGPTKDDLFELVLTRCWFYFLGTSSSTLQQLEPFSFVR